MIHEICSAVMRLKLVREYLAWTSMLVIFIIYASLGGDRFPSVLATGLFACIGLAFIHTSSAPIA